MLFCTSKVALRCKKRPILELFLPRNSTGEPPKANGLVGAICVGNILDWILVKASDLSVHVCERVATDEQEVFASKVGVDWSMAKISGLRNSPMTCCTDRELKSSWTL